MEKNYLGVMLDCSRNAVITVPSAKRYMDILKKMGYNMLMLYTEDTYEIDGHPGFGYLRGRYSKAELKEMVAYAESIGIEMIPCIQTLAHLERIFRWPEFQAYRDCNDILLIDDDRTYELIEGMFKTMRECYKTDKIHIGMDEAHMVGLGKYKDIHGIVDRFELVSKHLKRVADIAVKYGFKPMMWSDMFFSLATKKDFYAETCYKYPRIITDEIASLVPENISLFYWDYYTKDKKIYDKMIEEHQHFGRPIWFTGNAWKYGGFAPRNSLSIERTELAIKSCNEHGVKNVLIASWGDDGAEALPLTVLPSLFHAAECYRGNYDMDSIKQKFEELFGIAFDDYMLLDEPATVIDGSKIRMLCHIEKQVVYNDPFMGVYDLAYSKEGVEAQRYKDLVPALAKFADNEEFGYIFKYMAALCDFCSVKVLLGRHTREAYDAKDKEKLLQVVEEYKEAEAKFEPFYTAFRDGWLKDNKGFGFDVQDIRLGGVKMRLRSCRERLEDYINGVTNHIDELEEPIVDVVGPNKCDYWYKYVSPNVVSTRI